MMGNTIRPFRASPLWTKCLFASFALHVTALYVAVEHPMILKKAFSSFFSKNNPTPTYVYKDDTWNPDSTYLQHFFEEVPAKPQKSFFTKDSIANTEYNPSEEKEEKIDFLSSFPRPLREIPLENSTPRNLSSLLNPKESLELTLIPSSFAPPSSLDAKASLATPTQTFILDQDFQFSPIWIHDQIDFETLHTTLDPSSQVLEKSTSSFPISDLLPVKEEQKNTSISLNVREANQGTLETPNSLSFKIGTPFETLSRGSLAEINEYLPDDLAFAAEWNDYFTVKTTLSPQEDGYLFSLAITPKEDLSNQKMKQNFYFLIDSSSDVEKHKLSVFKKSVLKALTTLQPGDSFNIVLLDQKAVKLSPFNLSFSSANIHLAEEFLEKIREKPLFSSCNLYKSLEESLTIAEFNEEIHTAILLTNGKAALHSSAQGKDLKAFLDKNNGKMNIFTAAVGQNNDLTCLDMISSLSGGKLLYSDTNAAFPRKLTTFIKTLQTPVMKNLSISIEATNSKANIKLENLPKVLPNLYNSEPFIVMGKIDRLCDLHLVVQGQGSDGLIFLKKEVSLEDAHLSGSALKKEWALQNTINYYEKFLKDSKASHLKNAKELLKTAHGKAFE